MLPAASAISKLQAQLRGEGAVRAWKVCTTLLPAQGPSNAITSGSEPWRSQGQGRRGSAHLTWTRCARPVEALYLCPPPLYFPL